MIDDIKKRALHRVRIIEGQLRAIERQIEDEDYCVDIVTQSLAVQRSLASLNSLLVENHLRTHVPHMLQAGGDERERAIDEMVRLYGIKGRAD
ncbi:MULTISPECIES: metal-sensitive transcriptional regulator [unclassified Pseudoclavibacter]|uniref:metal-sensitive transcriptional regulator n=1 Tax=unclassified Pseudoclavibacter TaxID=2615177 RepID=UPI0013017121|nr:MULTISPECIES: metal-sensitive transcriptional regulator [unclassified Pseudoclavibacter]KAB1645738.1 metal-sensitive transcriptional regulator [Pseudoclavibacter sp. CFCC 14310]KAB1658681.1 metal-sensitive transcriptional regulator [Pseudoclavibacter sp. CFCC 11306]KAB1661258.1 metal-sensitive transcriptional regulator [Pseudoclavibacter sp. CFCC 13796]KAB1664354.1 metal-sensitive transcriptional regulator [Pseudoclavibacter sp. CFCC 13611]